MIVCGGGFGVGVGEGDGGVTAGVGVGVAGVGVGVAGVGVGDCGDGVGGGVGCIFSTTKIGLLVPVIEGLLVSVAVIVWLPGEYNITWKMAAPLVNVLSIGKFPLLLVVVKWTVPV